MRTLAIAVLLLAPQAQSDVIVIKGGRFLTVANGDLEDAVIVIENGKIAKIGKEVAIPTGAKVIELPKGACVAPGFIDAHSYLASAFEVEEGTESVTPEVKAIEAFTSDHPDVRAALSSGVTMVAIAPGNGNLIGGRVGVLRLNGRRYDQMIVKDVAATKLSLSNEALRFDREPTSRQGAMTLLRRLLKEKPIDGIVFLHASAADDIQRALDLAASFKLRAVLVHADEAGETVDAIKAAKIPVAFGPIFASDKREKLEAPAKLAKAGISIAFVSDAPATSESQLRLAAAIAMKHGLERDAALRALTMVPAAMLGLSDRVGSLEAGKDADLVIYSGDPLSLTSDVETVIVEGRISFQKPKK